MTTKTTFEDRIKAWAATQPHAFYSMWPIASRTKCDFCGVYYPDHQPAPAEEDDVAKHPMKAVKVEA